LLSQAFDESLSNHLFVNKMSQLDFTTLTMAGFKVFERYLLHINEKNSNLKPIDKKTENPIVDAKSFVVVSPDLVGIDNLWRIALDAQQSAVYQLAISELNTLHQVVGDTR
jgi:hypothetical protein